MRLPPARATIGFAGVTVAAYLIGQAVVGGAMFGPLGGFIPARISGVPMPGAVPAWATPLTATLIHGGLFHLAMNMVMLVFCGRLVEPGIGARGMIALYLVGAYAAAAAQWAWSPWDTTAMVGASGAIAAVIAAYALLFGERRVRAASPGLSRWLTSAWLAAAWTAINLLIGVATRGSGLSIAVPAHIGGFVAGLLLTRPLLRWRFGGARRALV